MSNSPRGLHVLVVDDSAVVRQTIRSLLDVQAGMRTSVAHDPLIAIEKMKVERPDVIILDLAMPRMDGLTFLQRIMEEDPLPVIVCSGHVGDSSNLAIRALEAGAVELLAKPKVGVQAFLEESAVLLADSVRAAALCKPSLRARRRGRMHSTPARQPSPVHGSAPSIIAIGASTGGPEALREILEAVPATMPPIAIVQHMPSPFTRSFANRLDEVCAIEVKEAEPGDEFRPGVALLAPGDRHLVVTERGSRFYAGIVDGPLVSRHRPSVDVLFRSVAAVAGASAAGVILTGMGADGAAGLAELCQTGAYTVAEDEASCTVFGMPNEAIKRGGVCEVLPLASIAGALIQRCARS